MVVVIITIIMATIFQVSALRQAFNPSSDKGRFYYLNVTDTEALRDAVAAPATQQQRKILNPSA